MTSATTATALATASWPWFENMLAPGPTRTMALAVIGATLIFAGVIVIALLIRGRPSPADRALRLVERNSRLDRPTRRALREICSAADGPPPVALYLSEHAFQTAVQMAHRRGQALETKPLERACVGLGYSLPRLTDDANGMPISQETQVGGEDRA